MYTVLMMLDRLKHRQHSH